MTQTVEVSYRTALASRRALCEQVDRNREVRAKLIDGGHLAMSASQLAVIEHRKDALRDIGTALEAAES
jgi:hypothetical protein